MTRKILFLMSVILAFAILSGCSLPLLPKSLSKQKKDENNKANGTSEVFNSEAVIGSLWKTSDGGHSFESKSKLDKDSLVLPEMQSKKNDGKNNVTLEVKPDDGKDENSNGTIDNTVLTKYADKDGNWITTADVMSIAFNPKKPKVIFVGTANDGLFKTEDAGGIWKPIPFPPKNVYSFIIDKNDPDNRMFAAGVVGEWGKIFRTKDAGQNWEEVYTEPGEKVPVTGMAQHIQDTNIIFAGTKKGTVAKSIDAGNIWKNVGQMEDYWDNRSKKVIIGEKIIGNVSDFAFDAKNKSSIYLITYSDKLYYSNKTGDRWIDWELQKRRELQEMIDNKANPEVIKAFRERMEKEKMPRGIVSVVADPKISGIVYVGTNKGFFVSNSYGKWWKEVNIIESAKTFPIRSVTINPKNSNEIVFVSQKAFYKSIDMGKTWEVVGLNVDRDVSFVSYDPFDSNYLFIGLRKFKSKTDM